MTDPDPAARRFWAISITRLLGAGFVMLGVLMASGRLFAQVPSWVGMVVIVNGLVDVFVLPVILARKWRSPR